MPSARSGGGLHWKASQMTFDAAIIGGGISGLATAYALERQGYRVVVL
ncbi:MAG: FAD-dependent oxidoreductase, partial [Hyphomicrobiales bacterium]|nr:FAD-dependent oxidoreductase [Hyphomicrobiales bacterium]